MAEPTVLLDEQRAAPPLVHRERHRGTVAGHPVPSHSSATDPAYFLAPLPPGHPATSTCGQTAALARVLVVDHDESYCAALSPILEDARFEMSVATTGTSALVELGESGAEIVLLDLVLPDVSGTELCQQLRKVSDVPIIIVTARSNELDRVVALEVGADDFVLKPYSPRELVARMRAVLRRWRRPVAEEPAPPLLSVGPVRLDVERHLVTIRDTVVRLPLKEFELLELLMRNVGRVLTRRQIIERVWGVDYVGDTKTLDTHVRRLRRRLEPVPSEPRHLVTVRGMGFRFQP